MSQRRGSARHSVTVEIAGEKHVLRSDVSPEYTRAIAAHVDATIRQLGEARPVESHRTAILASLFITDELFRAREELRRLTQELERRAEALAALLEQATADGSVPPPEDGSEPLSP